MNDVTEASLPKAIFLMGPTASGKTALAIALRKVLPVELISVDSALIYRGMDIGTAKPDAAELSAAPHRLLFNRCRLLQGHIPQAMAMTPMKVQ